MVATVLSAGLLILTSLFCSSAKQSSQRTFELEIHRATSSLQLSCSFLSLKETQLHKDIDDSGDGIVKSSGRLYREAEKENEFVQYYANDVHRLLEVAVSNCGEPSSWTFPVFLAPELQFSESIPAVYDDRSESLQSFLSHDGHPSISTTLPSPPALEIVPLITTGRSSNRVDFVFFGDGYVREEKEKFIRDAQSLASDMANNQTFATVKPLLNFWAAFTPSNETGIGVGGKAKDTPFGLYRDGTELRGVYYAKPETAHAACLSMGVQCDYPILLGNDPLYGGLGGRFTVTTSSELNGALVLRHELGHSVIGEGEEYDGGFAYFGPNAANLTDPFPWAHWLSSHPRLPREERSVMPIQAYPWTMLNASSPWVVSFESSGQYTRYVIRFSLSGLPRKEHIKIKLDDEDLEWTPWPGIGLDRWHYDIHRNSSLQAGMHSLSFTLGASALVGKAQVCSVEVIEFGSAEEFNASDGYIGAFPTWSVKNMTSYRPTNEGCLMRIVTTANFCKVCVEGLWHALLKRVDLIDGISLGCVFDSPSKVRRAIELRLLALGQYRTAPLQHEEAYNIRWKKDGVALPEFDNETYILVENTAANFTVDVLFVSEEVRVDPRGYLASSADFEVPKCIVGRT